MKTLSVKTKNTSSPGASFTDNTNNVMLLIYDWIKENKNLVISFREFRTRIENEKGINDNNNRNIFPLLKNCGLVNYIDKHELNVDDFFTNEGIAYVDILESIEIIKSAKDIDDETKIKSIENYKIILQEYVNIALEKLVLNTNINYLQPFLDFILYLLEFKEIDKTEFAYMISIRENYNIKETFDIIRENINEYRKGDLNINVSVEIRNDNNIKAKTSKTHRDEGIAFITSYGYFSSLLEQAGLIVKIDNRRYMVCAEKIENLKKLGGYNNG